MMTVKDGGAKALFRGWVPSSLKIVPQAGASFLVYELVKKELMKQKKSSAESADDWAVDEDDKGKGKDD
jgi:solute carrier family 25 phosphate transporter 23/24/25/41